MRFKVLFSALFAFLAFGANSEVPCDLSLMRFVHSPQRLKVLNGCATVRGTVTFRYLNPWDGDYHINIKLDPEFKYLLNDSGRKKGVLVTEFVCQGWLTMKGEARRVCKGYANKLPLPKRGDYVEITGIHVEDTGENHNEIHPVSSIKIIRPKKELK